MDPIIIERIWKQGTPVQVDNLSGTAFTGEAQAHTFRISGQDSSGEALSITGAITGKFITSTQVVVPLTGSIDGGVAVVTLTSECYAVPGNFVFAIYATNGSTTQCLYACVGNVFRASAGTAAYPTASIPDLVTLVNTVQAAIASVPSDYTALMAGVANIFDTSTSYLAGKYIWYNGTLYRFTADHAAGNWTGTDAVAVAMGNDLDTALNHSSVRYDASQTLNSTQQGTARANIDAVSMSELAAVGTVLQTKSDQTRAMIAPAEASATAAAAHASGSYFTYNNLLYRATAAIAVGDTITPGTNCTAVSMGGDVTDLKSAFGEMPPGTTVEHQIDDLRMGVSNNATDIDIIERTIGNITPENTIENQFGELTAAIDAIKGPATSSDEGKSLLVKIVADGKVTAWEYGETTEIDDTAGEGDTNKTWSADRLSKIIPGLTEDAKVALLNCFAHVAWVDEHGQDYYDDLENALYAEIGLVSITAVFTQGAFIVYPSTPLNDLKAFLTVTGYYNDGQTREITDYALYGTLTVGVSTITVTAERKTATFTVSVVSISINVENGIIALIDGSEEDSETRARTDFIPCTFPVVFGIDADINVSNEISYAGRYYDANKNYIQGMTFGSGTYITPEIYGDVGLGWAKGDGTEYTDTCPDITNVAYVRFLMRTTAGNEIITKVSGTVTVNDTIYEIDYQ